MNIVQKREDGTVLVTTLGAEALAKMAEANGYAELYARKTEIEDSKADMTAQAEHLSASMAAGEQEWTALQRDINREISALLLDQDPAHEARNVERLAQLTKAAAEGAAEWADSRKALEESMVMLNAAIALRMEALRKCAFYESVRDNIGLTPEAHHELLVARARAAWEGEGSPPALKPLVVDSACVAKGIEVPQDRRYRAAWAWTTDAPSIDIDMAKARALRLDMLRGERNAELARLDVEARKAAGKAGEVEAINTAPQKLRDMPERIAPALEACSNTAALDAVTLDSFKTAEGIAL
jgi:hypothetical protein